MKDASDASASTQALVRLAVFDDLGMRFLSFVLGNCRRWRSGATAGSIG
jgi:hypothetical protein